MIFLVVSIGDLKTMFEKLSLTDLPTTVKTLIVKVDDLVRSVDKIEKMLMRLLGSSLENKGSVDYAKKFVSKYFDKIINPDDQTKQFPTSSSATLDALETILATKENAAVLFVSLLFIF